MKPNRIQPKDNDPPEHNPFEFDLLNREEAVKTLTRLIGAIEEGPCVLVVDAPWGAGKTTFLKIWAQYLRNENFPVVEFNAWKTDFSEDPFMALCAELTSGAVEEKGGEYAKKFMKAAVKVIQHIGSNTVEKATGGYIVPTKLWANLKQKTVETATEERLANHQKAQAVIDEFKKKLEDLARALNDGTTQADTNGHKPLVVMIDELDRCRPSYAVELLETAKHLFDVDRIVFVLAINRDQLAHAVRALYGADFKAEEYLRRFFDVDFRLPVPDRDKFIVTTLDSMAITDKVVRELLQVFFGASPLSLRDIAQAIHRFGWVLNSLPSEQGGGIVMTTAALILRTFNETLYHQFVQKEISDFKIAEEIFSIPPINPLRWEKAGVLFQECLVQAYKELRESNEMTRLEEAIDSHIEAEGDEERQRDLQGARWKLLPFQKDRDTFRIAHQHIELFSSSLIRHRGTS